MRRALRILAGLILSAVLALLALMFWPVPPFQSPPSGDRAPDAGSPEIRPGSGTIEMNHGRVTDRVYVLLHGVTNSPVQFRDFGKRLFDTGANVFIPRMPFHGYRDRMTDAQRLFTAQVMLDEANRAIDHAKTLGRKVTVVGLSVNGTTAAWVAQNRPDVEQAVLLAPLFAPAGLPDWLVGPLARLFSRLPNFFVWWDADAKENLAGNPEVYPRFATHSMATTLLLGLEVFRQARQTPPAVPRIVVITSAADRAINYPEVAELIRLWEKSAPGAVKAYQFPAEMKVPHDFIDPQQPDQQVERVYPVLLEIIRSSGAGGS